jgi:hypothetical protein
MLQTIECYGQHQDRTLNNHLRELAHVKQYQAVAKNTQDQDPG